MIMLAFKQYLTPLWTRRDRTEKLFARPNSFTLKSASANFHPDNHAFVGGATWGRIGTIAAPQLRTTVLVAPALEQTRLWVSTLLCLSASSTAGCRFCAVPLPTPEHPHRSFQDPHDRGGGSHNSW
jgi:hypothetical protein